MSVVFSWVWAISGIATIYFFVIALFGDGAWSNFFWALGISVVVKSLTRHFLQSEKQGKFEKQLMSEGYTREAAHKEYVHQLTTNEWSMERVEKIINDYGGVLAKKAPGPNGMVADEEQLPHPKIVIKQAILYMFEKGSLEEMQKDALVTGFFSLADFQPGVDDGDTGVDVGSEEFMALPTEEQIRKVAEGGLGQEWLEISATERDELVAELQREGHWKE